MSREMIRTMKRAVARARQPYATGESVVLAKEAALQLLARSINFDHGRLSVIRLVMAVKSGANVPQEHWLYCRHVAASCKDAGTQALFLEAVHAASSQSAPRQQTH